MTGFIHGLIISADPKVDREIREHAAAANEALHLRTSQHIGDEAELEAILRIYLPTIVFLDLADLPFAECVCDVIQRRPSSIQIIGVASEISRDLLLSAVRCGLRDVLQHPFTGEALGEAVRRTMDHVSTNDDGGSRDRRSQIHCFLPVKAGAGASTVALHTASAISRMREDRSVAFLDLDFDSGMVDFMLDLPADQGIHRLLEYSSRLDDSLWAKGVSKAGKLDVVRSGGLGNPVRAQGSELRELLSYARTRYEHVFLDLPGQLDEPSLAALEFCDTIFLVFTPELASVHVARRRLELFRELGCAAQVRLILNRNQANIGLSRAEIEELLETQIFCTIENDYAGLQKALLNGRLIDANTVLGRQFAHLALMVTEGEKAAAAASNGIARHSMWDSLKKLLGLAAPLGAAPEPHRLLLPAAPGAETNQTRLLSGLRSSVNHAIEVANNSRRVELVCKTDEFRSIRSSS